MELEQVFTVGHVREIMESDFGVRPAVWLYHQNRIPAPDRNYAGWPFYSLQQIDLVKAYFLRLTAVKRYMKVAAEKKLSELQTA
jgi:hypothetical protein